MIKKNFEETTFSQRRKNYLLEVNDKVVEIEKWWIDIPQENCYDIDWDILSIKSQKTNDDESLSDDEVDELDDFLLLLD